MTEAIELPKVAAAGGSTSPLSAPASVFAAPQRDHLVYEAVQAHLARKRSGNAATKTRAFVSGGGRKPFRQKGTGRARQGSIRAGQWVGGATIFGPQPRSYAYQLPSAARRAAMCSALSDRVRAGELMVVDEIDVPSGKTKDMAALLGRLEAPNVLIVLSEVNESLRRAASNLPCVKVMTAAQLSVYDVLRYKKVLIGESAVASLGERLL